MLSKDDKEKILKKFAKTTNDSGSCQVQIALLSERINQISNHLKAFPKDKHSRLGLVKLVGKRKTLYNYIKKHDLVGYKSFVKQLKDNN